MNASLELIALNCDHVASEMLYSALAVRWGTREDEARRRRDLEDAHRLLECAKMLRASPTVTVNETGTNGRSTALDSDTADSAAAHDGAK